MNDILELLRGLRKVRLVNVFKNLDLKSISIIFFLKTRKLLEVFSGICRTVEKINLEIFRVSFKELSNYAKI